MAIPADQLAVMEMLGRAFVDYEKQTGARAILVGGAAVSIFTDGAYLSGDFDIVAAADTALDRSLTKAGFVREDRPRYLKGGWYSPSYPAYGVEAVSGAYFDGRADVARLKLVSIGPDSTLTVAPVEDMIADRLGQFAAAPHDRGPLRQAKLLYRLSDALDLDYLTKRVRDEQGDMQGLMDPGWE